MLSNQDGHGATDEEKQSGVASATLSDLIRHHATLKQRQQLELHRQRMPSAASNSMIHFPAAAAQMQRQQRIPSLAEASSTAGMSSSVYFLQDVAASGVAQPPPAMGYNTAMTAAAMRNPSMISTPAFATTATPGSSVITRRKTAHDPSTSSSPSAADLNLSAEVTFLRQQQQRAAVAARVAAAERMAVGRLDSSSSYLQGRLGSSDFGASTAYSGLSSPSLSTASNSGFPLANPSSMSELARALMQSRNVSCGSTLPRAAIPGLPSSSSHSKSSSDFSRAIMMLQGEFLGSYPGNSTANSSAGVPVSASSSSVEANLAGGVASWISKYETGDLRRARESPMDSSFMSSRSSNSGGNSRIPCKKRMPRPSKGVTSKKSRSVMYKKASVPTTSVSMPYVLYSEDDDDYLTPYQCLLRKQLELFVADSEDVRCSSQQGRTTNIQVGQVGLRCRHCEGGLASRTKGAVYYSHSVDGIYQIGQNIGKVHLAERCYRIPDDIRRKLVALRNDSRRASSGKAYWSDRIRALGVYEEEKILKFRSGGADSSGGDTAMPTSGGSTNPSNAVADSRSSGSAATGNTVSDQVAEELKEPQNAAKPTLLKGEG